MTTVARVLGRLTLAKKFALIAITFIVPLAYVANSYVGVQSAQVDFAKKERQGVVYLKPTQAMLFDAVKARTVAVKAAAAGNQPTAPDFATDIKAIDAVEAKYGKSFATTDTWNKVKGDVTSLDAAHFAN